MIIILEEANYYKKTYYSKSFEELEKFIYEANSKNNSLLASVYAFDENLKYDELVEMKKFFSSSNIQIKTFITNSRETLISAKFLQIKNN